MVGVQHCLEDGGATSQVILHPMESSWQCSADCKVHIKTEVPTGLILLWECNFSKYSTEEPTINVKSWPQTFLEAEDNNCNPPAAELEKDISNLDTVSSWKSSLNQLWRQLQSWRGELGKHKNSSFQFPIGFEESKELSMEISWTEVLKKTLARSLEYLYGKDGKKKVGTQQAQTR